MKIINFKVVREIDFDPGLNIKYIGIPANCPAWARRWIESRLDWIDDKKVCQLLIGGALTDEIIINGKSYKKPGTAEKKKKKTQIKQI